MHFNLSRVFVLSFIMGFALTVQAQQPAVTAVSDLHLLGTWQGIWKRSDGDARTVLKISSIGESRRGYASLDATLYLVDQPGMTIHFVTLTFRGQTISLDDSVLSVHGGYEGTLSADGNTITGLLIRDGKQSELNLTRLTPGTAEWEVRTPTADDLHQYLETSYRRSVLIADKAAPFHLYARIDVFRAGEHSPSYATLDEIWRDPFHWKSTVTYEGNTFTEVDNGRNTYTIGAMPKISLGCVPDFHCPTYDDVIPRAEEALFSPFRPELLTTHRLTLAGNDCVNAEPELAAVPSTPVAETTYCLAPYDLNLRNVSYPIASVPVVEHYGYTLKRYDLAPFGDKDIARTIDATVGLERRVSVHVTILEPAVDFSVLNDPAPAGAKLTKSHRQDMPIPSEIMAGQLISESSSLHGLVCPNTGTEGVMLTLHVGANGQVTGSDVISDPDHVMTPAAFEAVKAFRYRISYRGNQPIAVDRLLWTGFCVV